VPVAEEAYSPECVEGKFCELRLNGVLRTSPRQGTCRVGGSAYTIREMEDSRSRPGEPPPMAARVVVRHGHAEDFAPAFALWWRAESARRYGPPPSVSVKRVLGYARRTWAFLQVADLAGALVGMALITPASSRPAEVAFVQMVFVAPECWGEGIGGKLVAAALGEAKTRGFKRAELWAHADDERARGLYEGHGFGRTGCRKAGDSGEPIVLYERPL
jgi:GNAT superfamily N-acetyltransferase